MQKGNPKYACAVIRDCLGRILLMGVHPTIKNSAIPPISVVSVETYVCAPSERGKQGRDDFAASEKYLKQEFAAIFGRDYTEHLSVEILGKSTLMNQCGKMITKDIDVFECEIIGLSIFKTNKYNFAKFLTLEEIKEQHKVGKIGLSSVSKLVINSM